MQRYPPFPDSEREPQPCAGEHKRHDSRPGEPERHDELFQVQQSANEVELALRGTLGYYGRVSAAGINVVAKKPNEVSKAMIYAAMVETYAILGLLTSILLVINVGNIA